MRAGNALAAALAVILIGSSVVARADGRAIGSIFDRFTTKAVTLQAGTVLPIVLDTPVASNTSRVEQAISGHTSRDVMASGLVVIPAGSEVRGVVTSVRRSGKVKGRAHIGVRFIELVPKDRSARYRIQTSAIARTAPATKKNDALKIGGPAAGGALVGALIGGKKGALIGAGAGGGAGTAVVLSTRGKEIGIPRGAALTVRLASPVTVKVKT